MKVVKGANIVIKSYENASLGHLFDIHKIGLLKKHKIQSKIWSFNTFPKQFNKIKDFVFFTPYLLKCYWSKNQNSLNISILGNHINVEGLMQTKSPQALDFTLLWCVMVNIVGHTIAHQRVSHTISMPTILTIKRVHRLWYLLSRTIFCKGPDLDAYRSQSAMFANCQYDIVRQHK